MEIRNGTASEIKEFDLYNEDNDGDEILVAVENGIIVAYVQFTDEILYFIESNLKGAGSALISELKDRLDHIVAWNVEKTAQGFYEKMGFEKTGSNGYMGQFNMEWWTD
jgi:hypothetical protein